MTNKPITNMAASIRQRLLNRARERGEDFQLLLTRYCIERLLYRVSQSDHADRFILKGATLFLLWQGDTYRPTRDLDLLARGDCSPSHMEDAFKTICTTKVKDDGLQFDASTVRASDIREDQEYGGVRVMVTIRLGQARIELQVDVGVGDALVPPPRKVDFPSLLGLPQPRLRVYRAETVVAEKFQAMVALGIANSRMKDFYDVWTLANDFEFDGKLLCQAIKATFNRRRTAIPTQEPLALTKEFHEDAAKQTQWTAFVRKNALGPGGHALSEIVDLLRVFLVPPAHAAAEGTSFEMTWSKAGPWEARSKRQG